MTSDDPRLRIGLVSANYAPSVGGIERFVETLAEALAEAGHSVRVLCCRFGSSPPQETRNGVSITRISASHLPKRLLGVPYPVPSPMRLRSATLAIARSSDVVHVQDLLYATTLPALAAARNEPRAVGTVLTQHVGFVPQRNRLLNAAQAAAFRTIGRAATRRCDIVATNSLQASEFVQSALGVRPIIMPAGTSIVANSADGPALRAALGIDPAAKIALFAGRDVPKKNLNAFLGAVSPGRYTLVAVTDRPAERREGLVILPFMPPPEFSRLLAIADAFVLPSDAEGVPIVLQEALLSGIPTLVRHNPGYERFFSSTEVICIDPTAESIRENLARLMSDDRLRARLSNTAKQAGQRSFGLDPVVQAYEGLYRQSVHLAHARVRQSR